MAITMTITKRELARLVRVFDLHLRRIMPHVWVAHHGAGMYHSTIYAGRGTFDIVCNSLSQRDALRKSLWPSE